MGIRWGRDGVRHPPALPRALGHEVSHVQAHLPELAVTPQVQEIAENIVHNMGFGLGR